MSWGDGKFYHADVDAAASVNATAITLYAVDPTDGTSTSQPVTGCDGYPVGFAFDEARGVVLLTTQTNDEVSFCSVDVGTAAGTRLTTLPRGDAEDTSTSYYAAYVSHASDGVATRVGHQLVTTGASLGIGTGSGVKIYRVAATPRAATRTVRRSRRRRGPNVDRPWASSLGDDSRRRRGRDADHPRVAETPRPRRGSSLGLGAAAATTWIVPGRSAA